MGKLLKIVVTGPESSGKTTLAFDLAAKLGALAVPEFARTYLNYLGRSYTPADLPNIYKGQIAWEDFYSQQNTQFLICDTDWTVLKIWADDLGYQFPSPIARRTWDLALLCRPDIPWVPDPLREHPEARDRLFRQYQQVLTDTGWPFIELSGKHDKRMTTALTAIRSL